jgi:hypothetical protein
MHFKLFPRFLDDEIAWDDYDLPLHDVVRSTPVSNYDFPNGRPRASLSDVTTSIGISLTKSALPSALISTNATQQATPRWMRS